MTRFLLAMMRLTLATAFVLVVTRSAPGLCAEGLSDADLCNKGRQASENGEWANTAMYLFACQQRDPAFLRNDPSLQNSVSEWIAFAEGQIRMTFDENAKQRQQLDQCGVARMAFSLNPPAKLAVFPANTQSGAVSGQFVGNQAALPRTVMWGNIDMPGNDFANFDLQRDDPTLCQSACLGDAKCVAWTYVKPDTIQGPRARCWLKNPAPAFVENSCCISGAKQQ